MEAGGGKGLIGRSGSGGREGSAENNPAAGKIKLNIITGQKINA